jgi:hypothetical protein
MRSILGFLAGSLFAVAAFAQSTGAIQGTITDPSGAAVPKAVVTLENQATAEQRSTITDDTGRYLAPSLPVGTYRVAVKAPGLQTTTVAGLVLGWAAPSNRTSPCRSPPRPRR